MSIAEIRSYIGGRSNIGSVTFDHVRPVDGKAFRFVDDFDVGALWINEASRFRLDLYPFGGVKQSGVGREGIRYAIDELSQIKFIGMRP